MTFEDALLLRKIFKSQTTIEEATALYNGVLETPEGAILEVGSATGGTTVMLLAAAEQVCKHVYSVDPYPIEYESLALNYTEGIMSQFKQEFKENILDGSWYNITQFNDTLYDCWDHIPNDLSLVFIDSCHELSVLINELKLVFSKVRKGGRIYIHDVLAKIGQLSKTGETGLINIWGFLFRNMYDLFPNTRLVSIKSSSENIMLCVEKL
jgi:predicted O-methyltransferase YrrM